MQPFLVLLAQIFIVALIHSLLEVYVEADKNPFMGRIINIACYIGSLYFLLSFIFTHFVKEISVVIDFIK